MLKKRSKPSVEAQDHAGDAARAVGARLSQARQARGEELYAIAAYLRIRPAYLLALEQGDLASIPGRAYVFGFVRSYAAYLGLDGERLVAELKGAADRAAAPPELTYREPIAESRRGTAVMVVASLLLAAAVYSSYYVIYHVDRGPAEPVAEATGDVAQLAANTLRRGDAERAAAATLPAPPPAAIKAPGDPAAAPARPAAQPGTDIPALQAREVPAEPAAPEASRSATAANAAPASASELLAQLDSDRVASTHPVAATLGDPAGRLSLVALESSLIQIRSPGRDYVRTRTLQPGEKFVVPNRADLALWTGNAGGIELVIDGRSQGPLGQPGEVLKAMPLNADQLKARALR